MQAAELDADFDVALPRPHRRAVAIIVGSAAVIAIAAVAWVHPDQALFSGKAPAPASALRGDYRVSTIDFVSPTAGWLVVDMPTGDYVLIHTSDGGTSWTRQLGGASSGHGNYVKFFDASVGIFA